MQFSENADSSGNVLLKSPTRLICQTRPTLIFGGHKAVVRPVPIPNTAVKHSLADGSSSIGSARVGRRQPFKKAETKKFVSAFLLHDSFL